MQPLPVIADLDELEHLRLRFLLCAKSFRLNEARNRRDVGPGLLAPAGPRDEPEDAATVITNT